MTKHRVPCCLTHSVVFSVVELIPKFGGDQPNGSVTYRRRIKIERRFFAIGRYIWMTVLG